MSVPEAYVEKLSSWGFPVDQIPESIHPYLGNILTAGFPEDVAINGLREMISYANMTEAVSRARSNDRAVVSFVTALVREFPLEMEEIGVEGIMAMVKKSD